MAEGRRNVRAKLVEYFEQRPNKTVYLKNVAEDLGELEATVQTGIRNLRKLPGWEQAIEVIARGSVWRYVPQAEEKAASKPEPKAAGTGRCFEQIGQTRDGDLILQCEDGSIYRATEL